MIVLPINSQKNPNEIINIILHFYCVFFLKIRYNLLGDSFYFLSNLKIIDFLLVLTFKKFTPSFRYEKSISISFLLK